MLKYGCVMVILISLCVSAAPAGAQGEPTYLGEVCFELNSSIPNPLPGATGSILQLGVLSYGAGHYSLNGRTDSLPVYGSAVIDDRGGNPLVLISLTLTNISGDYWLYFLRYDVNQQTGDYTAYGRRTYSCFGCLPPGPEPWTGVISGTVALHACP